jgi:ubiquinone biosynthesis protein COQ9
MTLSNIKTMKTVTNKKIKKDLSGGLVRRVDTKEFTSCGKLFIMKDIVTDYTSKTVHSTEVYEKETGKKISVITSTMSMGMFC